MYILILMIWMNYGGGVTTAEFYSKQDCENAITAIKSDPTRPQTFTALCVPKGK